MNEQLNKSNRLPGSEKLTRPEEIGQLSKYLKSVREYYDENTRLRDKVYGVSIPEVKELEKKTIRTPSDSGEGVKSLDERIIGVPNPGEKPDLTDKIVRRPEPTEAEVESLSTIIKKIQDVRDSELEDTRLDLIDERQIELSDTRLDLKAMIYSSLENKRIDLTDERQEELETTRLDLKDERQERLEDKRLNLEDERQNRLEDTRLDLKDERQNSLEDKRLDLDDTRNNRLEDKRLDLEDKRENQLEDKRLDLEDKRENQLEDKRLDLEDERQSSLEDKRLDLEDERQNSLEDKRLDLEDERQERLENTRLDLEDKRQEKLEDTRLDLKDERQTKLETERLNLEDERQVRLETERLDLKDERTSSLSDKTIGLDDSREVRLETERLDLTDSRQTELEDTRLDLDNIPTPELNSTRLDLEDIQTPSLSDKIIELDDERKPKLGSTRLDITDERKIELGGKRIDIKDENENQLETERLDLDNIPTPELNSTRLDLEDIQTPSLSDKLIEIEDTRQIELEDSKLQLTDERKTELETTRLDLEDERKAELGSTRLDLEDERETELGSTRLDLEDEKEIELGSTKLNLSDSRETTLEDIRLDLSDERKPELDSTRLDITDKRDPKLENKVLEIADERKPELEDSRIDLKDERTPSLSDKLLNLLDSREPELEDKQLKLKDERKPELEDKQLKLEDERKPELEDEILKLLDERKPELEDEILKLLDERDPELEDKILNLLNEKKIDLESRVKLKNRLLGTESKRKRPTKVGFLLNSLKHREKNAIPENEHGEPDELYEQLIRLSENKGFEPPIDFGDIKYLGANFFRSKKQLTPSDIRSYTRNLPDHELYEVAMKLTSEGSDGTGEVDGWERKVGSLISAYLSGPFVTKKRVAEFYGALNNMEEASKIANPYYKRVPMDTTAPTTWSKAADSVTSSLDEQVTGSDRKAALDEAIVRLVNYKKSKLPKLPGSNLGQSIVGAAKNVLGMITGSTDNPNPINKPLALSGMALPGGPGDTIYQAANNRTTFTKIKSDPLGAMEDVVGGAFYERYWSSDSFKATLEDLCPIVGKAPIASLMELKAILKSSPYFTTPGKFMTDSKGSYNTYSLDTNMYWEVIIEPYCGKNGACSNGGYSFLPAIGEVNAINRDIHKVYTNYGRWAPISSFELQKSKLVSKSLPLYEGEISYPTGMEFTNELRLTFVDDAWKSWKRYFERCAEVAVYNSEPHESDWYTMKDSKRSVGKEKSTGITKIDKTNICIAPYKNIVFNIKIYILNPQLNLINRFNLLCVLKDYAEEYVGEIDAGGSDLNVTFSIVGENPEEDIAKKLTSSKEIIENLAIQATLEAQKRISGAISSSVGLI